MWNTPGSSAVFLENGVFDLSGDLPRSIDTFVPQPDSSKTVKRPTNAAPSRPFATMRKESSVILYIVNKSTEVTEIK